MAGPAIGVDLGATNARAAVVDAGSGALLAVHREPLGDRSPGAVVAVVARAVREVARAASLGPAPVGVGVAGQCLGRTGLVLNAPNLGWRDVALGEMLAGEVGAPVRVANDLSAAAWGEQRFGAARGLADVALVFVGSGVGAGLILGGRLHEGAWGVAGEIGHVKVQPPRPETRPRRCGCGQVGCLEAYSSGVHVAARVREELAAGAVSALREMAGGDLSRITAGMVDAAFGSGDPYARALWEEVGELLGTAVANLATVVNPSRVVLGGGVLLGCPGLEGLVRRRLLERVSASARRDLSVERAFLGDDAGVVGAALLGARAARAALTGSRSGR